MGGVSGGGLSPQAATKLALDGAAVSQADVALKKAQAKAEADAAGRNTALLALDAAAVKKAEDAEKKAQIQLEADQAAFGSATNAGTKAATGEDALRLGRQVAEAQTAGAAKAGTRADRALDLRV
ncbi:MAG: hypothetical protein ACRYGC_08620 [Janthinobacterium lividum]